SYGEWQAAGHLGDLLREMRRSFEHARETAPCILVIDEIDALGSRAGDDGHGRSYRSQAIAGLLTELDTLGREEGVILIGTCNHRDRLDPAILRPGRLDLHVEMPLPDETMLAQILQEHLPGEDHLALADLARRAVGHTPAELDAGIRTAKSAARQERRAPTLADIARHLELDDTDPAVTRRVAAHEAGHAIVATALGASRVVRMTLLRDGGETVRRQADRIGTWDDIHDELATHLAGRAAERLVYGSISAGAGGGSGSDLAIATELAVAFHMRLGLGWRGPVWSEAPSGPRHRSSSRCAIRRSTTACARC
ncbi:AAA family ATPase, partial [Frigidibacter sp. MR17.24]|uniref:AAA family ATPase n=1 Tax=Frigidibacter sp. MR17.24 TaxID=3127345 RepID=UPI003012EB35